MKRLTEPFRDSSESEVRRKIERTFREESGRIVATLIRVFGDFDVAEEAMQDSFSTALDRWPRSGIPSNAGAWITTTAKNKAIDRLRRDRVLRDKVEAMSNLDTPGWDEQAMPDDAVEGHVPSSGVRVRHPVDRGLCHCLRYIRLG